MVQKVLHPASHMRPEPVLGIVGLAWSVDGGVVPACASERKQRNGTVRNQIEEHGRLHGINMDARGAVVVSPVIHGTLQRKGLRPVPPELRAAGPGRVGIE